MSNAWTVYSVYGIFVNQVRGGKPADPELLLKWLRDRGLTPREEETAAEMIRLAQESAEIEGAERESMNIFARDREGYIYMNAYQFNAGLKMAMRNQKSVTMWRQKFQSGVRVLPERIYLTRGGKKLKLGDGFGRTDDRLLPVDADEEQLYGFETHTIHVEDRFGNPQAGLKKIEYVVRPEFLFDVYVANEYNKKTRKWAPIMDEELVRALLDGAEVIGFGAMHTMGFGQSTMGFEKKKE